MPVVFQDEAIGLLQVANRETDYTEQDVQVLESIGNTMLAPILHAKLQRDREEKARKKAEDELRELVHSLDERVKERTATLEEKQAALRSNVAELEKNAERLRQSEKRLQERNEELKGFAYTVSHDLKAPLRGICGYADELNRKHRAGLSERAQFCVTQVQAASRNLDHLIEDLLHYSRLDAETPAFTAVDVRGLVEAILRDRSLVIAERHIEVAVEIPIAPQRTWERGLLQVLTNLIDNAVKYSDKAAPARIGIRAEEAGNVWRIVVSDNGIGFDMKYHDLIYGLFNRLVRADEYEGTGLGLAIVKKVLDKLGGRVWADAAPGRGATFYVELPTVAEGSDDVLPHK